MPSPPLTVSAPPSPSSQLLLALPVMVLARLLPQPVMAAELSSRIRFSTLSCIPVAGRGRVDRVGAFTRILDRPLGRVDHVAVVARPADQ